MSALSFSGAKAAFAARQQRGAVGLIVLAAIGLWAYYAYAFRPLLRTVWQLGQEVRNKRTQVSYIEQAIGRQSSMEQESARLDADVGRLRAALPSDGEVLRVIERLSGLANDSGVKIQTVTPQRSTEAVPPAAQKTKMEPARPALYKEVSIQVDALGGWHQLGRFLSLLESDPQPVQIRTLRVAANSRDLRRHLISLVIVGFFSTAPSS